MTKKYAENKKLFYNMYFKTAQNDRRKNPITNEDKRINILEHSIKPTRRSNVRE